MRNRFVLQETAEETAPGGPPTEIAPSQPEVAPSPDWRESLSEEMKLSPSIQDVPDLDTLVKNYENTKAMVGNSIRLPTNDAGQEAIDNLVSKILENGNIPLMRKPDIDNPESMVEIYKALGRPEDAAGYTVPEDINGELFGSLSEKALELGLTRGQYEGMAAALGQQQMQEFEAYESQRTQAVGQLKGEWGPAFDQKVGRAAQIGELLGAPKDLIEALKNGTANAEAIRFMDTVATQLGTEGSQIAQQIGQVTEDTVAELHERRTNLLDRLTTEDLSPMERKNLNERLVKVNERIVATK